MITSVLIFQFRSKGGRDAWSSSNVIQLTKAVVMVGVEKPLSETQTIRMSGGGREGSMQGGVRRESTSVVAAVLLLVHT